MSSHTVLIVDDDPNILDGLRLMLHKTDYQATMASDPHQAMELIKQNNYDVIISDHSMPGMTGLELLSLARDRRPDSIRIMLTGRMDAGTAVKAINQGEVYRFLIKPCDPTELLVTLHLACEKLELERQNRRLLSLIRTNPELEAKLEPHDR